MNFPSPYVSSDHVVDRYYNKEVNCYGKGKRGNVRYYIKMPLGIWR